VSDRGDSSLSVVLASQRKAQQESGPPSLQIRRDRISRCLTLLESHQAEIVAALQHDFGVRSKDFSIFIDVAAAMGTLNYAKAHVERWMQPERRKVDLPLSLFGARAEVVRAPKGVVGIISPWNLPVQLSFGPLASVLAAGNRAMLKPSEHTPATSDLMARLIASAFDRNEVAVTTGDADVGARFAALPFDHLLFTGSEGVAREVMRAAAANLTPVTLELGGKSPAIVGQSANIEVAAKRVLAGKAMNAGQLCLSPDYVLIHSDQVASFTAAASAAVATMYPAIGSNPDYTAIINQRHFDRLVGLLDDARAKGATVVPLPSGAPSDFSSKRIMPPTLVLDVTDAMELMQGEIFGPILPVVAYDSWPDALRRVQMRAPALGLYYFGNNAKEIESVMTQTRSGGVTLNDVIMHIAVEDLPFGGVGAAGMGAYHGREGFLEFSHSRAVYRQTRLELIKVLRPPYGKAFRDLVKGRMKA
jgi:coniferyl-aldehyde dehydrogenase